jgi:very-short-patch-repair endonuclease
MTMSEQILWDRLRGRQFDGWKFRRQHAVGAFVLDFYCDELKLALEIDGGIHRVMDHPERDRSRQEILEELGIRFVRVRSADVERDVEAVIEQLRRSLTAPLPGEVREGRGQGDSP